MIDVNHKYEKKDTRSGFGAGMAQLAQQNPNVVALCADLTGSLKLGEFKAIAPDRFIQTGIAEANMIGLAAGMTIGGKIPFTGTFANFATGRVYDQIRQSVAYSNKNVKICASHAGLTLGEDGATHQILEDISMMRALPNMVVIHPCDFNQTKAATLAIADYEGPVYLRFGRPAVPNFTAPDQVFTIGKADVLNEGRDVTIVANGHLVWQAILAADSLAKEGIEAEVINLHTIKPFDRETVLTSIDKTGALITCEEHMLNGGIGEMICAALMEDDIHVPVGRIGVDDTFGESGTPDELMEKYGLTAEHIVKQAFRVLARKRSMLSIDSFEVSAEI